MKETVNFAWPVTSSNREDYDAFCRWMEEHQGVLDKNRIAIWGAGIRGTEFSLFFQKRNFQNLFFVDSNAQKWGGKINEFLIVSPEELAQRMTQGNVRILVSAEDSREIEKQLKQQGYQKERDFYTIQSGLYDKYIQEFQRHYGLGKRILFQGDCEFSKISIRDKNMENLAEMLRKKSGTAQIKVLAMHGMGLRSHYHVCKAQISEGMRPDVLMLMVNLDTLTGKQHLLPRSQHAGLLRELYQSIDHKNAEFEEYLLITEERSSNHQAEFFTRKSSGTGREDVKARNYFRLNYMYDLDIHTEGMIYLEKILELAKDETIKTVVFVPPVNYLLARQLLGERFMEQYVNNINKIRSVAERYDNRFLDLSFCLEPEMFAMPKTADETANEQGREKLAHLLYQAAWEEL